MRVLIVEDEISNYDALSDKLRKMYPSVEIDGPVANIVDLRRYMQKQSLYDVIFCDIRLEDGACFSAFGNMEITVPIIFTTAYDEYALKAFEANGIAYLLKPIKAEELRQATDKALALERGKQPIAMPDSIKFYGQSPYLHYLKARAYNGLYMIDVKDVSHFSIDKEGTIATMDDGKHYHIDHTLEQLIQRLDPMMFFRANRKCIINRKAILCIESHGFRRATIKLKCPDNEQVPISKSNVAALGEWIEQ